MVTQWSSVVLEVPLLCAHPPQPSPLQVKSQQRAVRTKAREVRRIAGLRPSDEIIKGGKQGLYGVIKGGRRCTVKQGGTKVGMVSYVPPAWLSGHVFRLPADAEAQHAAAMKQPGLHDHAVRWSVLREAQAEDEARLQRGHKKRMPWLTTAKHMVRKKVTQLSVDVAMAVLSLSTADQLRLRRHKGWQ